MELSKRFTVVYDFNISLTINASTGKAVIAALYYIKCKAICETAALVTGSA
jgi:hypothetical protein